VDLFDGADHAGLDQFGATPGTVAGLALVAHLRFHPFLLRQRGQGARFPDAVGERLSAVDMFARLHRRAGRMEMVMVRRAYR